LVGGSIEDSTGRPDRPIYEHAHAVERIRAAAEVVRALPFHFILTGRAENYLVGKPDIKDTIKRLRAYQEAARWVPFFAPPGRCVSTAPSHFQMSCELSGYQCHVHGVTSGKS
jgi:hypothetical protein